MSALARSVIGPSSGQRTCASVTGCQAHRSGGKHSANWVTRDEGPAAQVGFVAGRKRGDPVADVAVVVGEAGDGVVDELGRRRLAAPVELQLDGPVGDLAARHGRGPGERLGLEEVRLARQHLRQRALVDVQLVAVETFGELIEAVSGVGAQLGDEGRIEHDRRFRAAQRLEGALLDRCELAAGLHEDDCTEGVSQRPGNAAISTRAPLVHTRQHGVVDHCPLRPRRPHAWPGGASARARRPQLPLPASAWSAPIAPCGAGRPEAWWPCASVGGRGRLCWPT